MTDQSLPEARRTDLLAGLRHLDRPALVIWAHVAVAMVLVLPPFYYLVVTAFTRQALGAPPEATLANFADVIRSSDPALIWVTLVYAAGSSLVSLLLGVPTAWLVARTDVPFRRLAFMGAFLSLAVPVVIKGIGWILLLGPNNGFINTSLMSLFGLESAPIKLFSLGGMILIEGLLWTPIVFLLTLPTLSAIDPSMEEAAATSGARFWQVMWHVVIPLARPGILAVLLLTFIRALESFEVPLLIGTPGNLHTFTTVIFNAIKTGFIPRYGVAAAYALILIVIVALPLVFYYRATRHASRYSTITGKGYRPQKFALGWWKIPAALWILLIPLTLIAPILILLWASFLPTYASPKLADLGRMTLENYHAIWTKPDTLEGLTNSLTVSTISATLVAGLTFLFAWQVVRFRGGSRWLLDTVASVPLIFPGIVLGIAVLTQFLALRWIPIYGTIWLLVVAFVIRFLPYGMRYCYSGIISIHQELEESARVSGARTLRVLWSVVLPLAMPAVAAAWLYVFLITVRDLGMAVLLSGPKSQVVSVVILDLWQNGEVPQLGAMSVLLAVLVTLLGLVFARVTGRGQGLH